MVQVRIKSLYQFWDTNKVRSPSPIWSYQSSKSFRSPIWFYQISTYLGSDCRSDRITGHFVYSLIFNARYNNTALTTSSHCRCRHHTSVLTSGRHTSRRRSTSGWPETGLPCTVHDDKSHCSYCSLPCRRTGSHIRTPEQAGKLSHWNQTTDADSTF